jgi:hypothetical protein
MVLRILILSLVSLLAAWPVLRSELPAIIGPVWASGAGERWSVKILLPLLFLGALVCAAWGVPVESSVLPDFPSAELPSLFRHCPVDLGGRGHIRSDLVPIRQFLSRSWALSPVSAW